MTRRFTALPHIVTSASASGDLSGRGFSPRPFRVMDSRGIDV